MSELPRLLLLIALAGAMVTFLGSLAMWWLDEPRRIRRALTRVLKSPPEAVVIAPGRGRAAGFSFETGLAAVAWDSGAWCLVYRLDELTGAELLVDGQVIARANRGEARRALDQIAASAAQVTLRLLFDDPRNPDFDLDLYLAGDETRRNPGSPKAAIQEANRWLARAEAILRRPPAPRGPTPVTRPEPPPQAVYEPVYDEPEEEEEEPAYAAPPPAPPPPPTSVTAPRKRKAEVEDDDQDDLPF